jgi:S-adenosylmethionine decarboxylase
MKHILFTLKECDSKLLDDEAFVKEIVAMAADVCRSSLLAINSYKFMPQGVTCVALLAESHISIHTWPEKSLAVCDVFTCGDHTDPQLAVDYMQKMFRSQEIVSNTFIRPIDVPPQQLDSDGAAFALEHV